MRKSAGPNPAGEAHLPLLRRLGDFFAERQAPAYLVGGSVRDRLLGRKSDDIDIAVGGPALELAKEVAALVGGHYVPMDAENEVARVILPRTGDGVELHLDISTMRGRIEEDLAGRDFTIDAMAAALGEPAGEIIDPFGGRRDIEAKLVRAVSELNLRRDPLRLLRAVRLAAELGFEIDSDTADPVQRHSRLVATVSAERVRDELYRIIAVQDAGRWLGRLDELGLLSVIIPELEPAKGAAQPKEHHWDVFRHSLETVDAVEYLIGRKQPHRLWQFKDELLREVPWSASLDEHFDQETSAGRKRGGLLKMIGLLHDVAKPECKTIDENGRIRFLGHANEGAIIASRVLERLRFSAREVDIASRAIENHLRPGTWGDELPTDHAIYRFFRDTGDAGIDVVFLNLADHLASRGPLLTLPEWESHAQAAGHVLAEYFREKSVVRPPKLLDGRVLMERFKLSPGPLIGEIIEALREAQAVGEIETQEEALAFAETFLMRGVHSPLGEVASRTA